MMFLQCVLIILTGFVAYLGQKKDLRSRTASTKRDATGTVVLILLLTGGSIVAQFFSQLDQKKEKAELKDSFNQLSAYDLQLRHDYAQLSNQVSDSSHKISDGLIKNARQSTEELNTAAKNLTAKVKETEGHLTIIEKEIFNNLTGGNIVPALKIYAIKRADVNFERYYVLHFDLYNPGKYPLTNMRAVITDKPGKPMERFVTINRGPDGTKITPKNNEDSTQDPNPEHDKDIGNLAKKGSFNLYDSAYNPELYADLNPTYKLDIKWGNHVLSYLITFVVDRGKLAVRYASVFLNGKVIAADRCLFFEYQDR